MGSYPESFACLSVMAELGPVEAVDCRSMPGGVVDLLSGRLSAETLSSLELDPSLLPTSEDAFPPSPPSPQPPAHSSILCGASHRQYILTDTASILARGKLQSRSEWTATWEGRGHLSRLWGVLALPLNDSSQFHSLIASDGLLMSTALSMPMTPRALSSLSAQFGPLSLPQTVPVTPSTPASSPSSPTSQTKHLLPPTV